MRIKPYLKKRDEEKLMRMLKEAGEEWACYWEADAYQKYCKALEHSVTYVAYEEDELCGYSRSLNDHDFYVYICDLFVKPAFRGGSIGKKLMEVLYDDFPEQTVFVMSDADGYYEKNGYKKEGSIFVVRSKTRLFSDTDSKN